MSQPAITQAYEAARARFPRVALPAEEFAARAAGLDEAALRDHGGDLFLAWACAAGDPAALRQLDDAVLRPALDAVRSIDASAAFTDEVCQRVRAQLVVGDGRPRLFDYAGRGPLTAWVGVTMVRAA